jgi:hypothetical protein
MRCVVEVSAGELLDRISILELKVRRLPPSLAKNAARSLAASVEARDRSLPPSDDLAKLSARLEAVNAELWDAEEGLRALAKERRYGESFVRLARGVCEKNDLRAALKREVDTLVGSELGEQKSYPLPEP